jgi:hypothetical protein
MSNESEGEQWLKLYNKKFRIDAFQFLYSIG